MLKNGFILLVSVAVLNFLQNNKEGLFRIQISFLLLLSTLLHIAYAGTVRVIAKVPSFSVFWYPSFSVCLTLLFSG